MTYEAEAVKEGAIHVRILEIDAPYCLETMGVAPCTSTQTGDGSCFNTRHFGATDCGDVPNFNPGTKTYRFCEDVGVYIPDAIPCIAPNGITVTQPMLSYNGGLGTRGVASITLHDFPWHDKGIDKNIANRTYTPLDRGTYWGKWLARDPFYRGATARILEGFVSDGVYDAANFKTLEFVVDDVEGPANGRGAGVTVRLKDRLILTWGEDAQYPAPSTGTLTADLPSTGTSFSVGTDEGAEYPTGTFYVAINKEILNVTRSGDNFTINSRGLTGGEAADDHDQGDIVQVCVDWQDVECVTVLQELLEEGASIPTAKIDTVEFASENSGWLESYKVTRRLVKPTSVDKLIGELGEQNGFNVWSDLESGKIRLRAIRPSTETIQTYKDSENFIEDTARPKDEKDKRASIVVVYYGQIDLFSNDSEPSNFVSWNAFKPAEVLYNTVRVKKVFATWLGPDDHIEAGTLANNWYLRSKSTPKSLQVGLHAKDAISLSLGLPIRVETSAIQGTTGSNETRAMQVLGLAPQAKPTGSTKYQLSAIDYQFDARFLRLMAAGDPAPLKDNLDDFLEDNLGLNLVDNSSGVGATENYADASSVERETGGYLCDDDGLMPDGTEGYRLA